MLGGPGSARQNARVVGSGSVLSPAGQPVDSRRPTLTAATPTLRATELPSWRAPSICAFASRENSTRFSQPSSTVITCTATERGRRQHRRGHNISMSLRTCFLLLRRSFLWRRDDVSGRLSFLREPCLDPERDFVARLLAPRSARSSRPIVWYPLRALSSNQGVFWGFDFQGIAPGVCAFEVCLLYVQGPVNLRAGSYTHRVLQHVQHHVPSTNRRCQRPSAISPAWPSGQQYYSRATARNRGKF